MDGRLQFSVRVAPRTTMDREALDRAVGALRKTTVVESVSRSVDGPAETLIFTVASGLRVEGLALASMLATMAGGGRVVEREQYAEGATAWFVFRREQVGDATDPVELSAAATDEPVVTATLGVDDLPVAAFAGNRGAAAAWLETNGGTIRDGMIADGRERIGMLLEADGLGEAGEGPCFGDAGTGDRACRS